MRKFLLYSSALVVGGLLSGSVAEAACIQTPTCSSLGYTSTSSCTGGTKCPFGNAWNCTASDLNDKITELEKTIEELQQNSSSGGTSSSNCIIGDILYSDMTCNPNVISDKTPIGVVFDRANKLAIGLEESSSVLAWSDFTRDVPELSNIESSSTVEADWQGKNNTKIVLEYYKANGKSCPAFEYVNSYKTEGTQAGDWYLPAGGELQAIYSNKDVLNITLGKIEGTKFGSKDYWSSSEYSYDDAWYLQFSNGYMTYYDKYGDTYYCYVRPVINFGDLTDEDSSTACNIGDIFYSDKTCSADVVSGKTPIGVVFDTTNRLIIGLEEALPLKWSTTSFDISGVSNIGSSSAATADWQGKNNTKTVLEYCKANGYSCPAFEYVNSYKTAGTSAGDWYLPAMGELTAIYINRAVLDVTLGKIGGTTSGTKIYWSSSEFSKYYAWMLEFNNGNVLNYDKEFNNYYVRPVLAF